MAYNFSPNSGLFSGSPIGAEPLTMACWAYPEDAVNWQTLVSSVRSTGDFDFFALQIFNDRFRMQVRTDAGDGDVPICTNPLSVNTWHHVCGVVNNVGIKRAIFMDGSNKGTNAGATIPNFIDRVSIGYLGRLAPASYFDGSLGEVAMWNVALTDAEVAILALGYSPLLVRPENCRLYPPLIRDADRDIVGGYSFTPFGGPTITPHPRVMYPDF